MTPNQKIVAKIKADLAASKGGNMPGVTEDHRHELANQLKALDPTRQVINTTETLEALIDQVGLFHVLTGLELLCLEKAEHLVSNWQDKASAKNWERMAKGCRALAMKDTTA